jgi:tRNASer (uridine44-2'-O)-methyltransferase
MDSQQSSEPVTGSGDQELEHDISIQSQQTHTPELPRSEAETQTETPPNGDKFEPLFQDPSPTTFSGLPPEIWSLVYSAPANFTPHYFLEVSRNLLENPNLTASHLSRAELSYQSFTDASYNPSATHPHELASIVKHMKADHQPLLIEGGVPDYTLEWTVVRKLIPRNPKLDAPLMQTCHLYTSTVITRDGEDKEMNNERYLIIYLPHVATPEEIPFYHPKVAGLAILYSYTSNLVSTTPGTVSIHYKQFPSKPLDNRLQRTALKMLEIVHKHARGRAAGYQKRVHHDVIIPQKPFQDTYAYLKGKYAKQLIDNWVEVTPAQKHVFEDLGIASFLIELWTEMYGGKKGKTVPQTPGTPDLGSLELNDEAEIGSEHSRRANAQQNFPGFVDIGCGNGILVWILHQEGWKGWGFDARRRKSWDMLEPELGPDKLKEMLLVPEVLSSDAEEDAEPSDIPAHNGLFPSGTFIVSNHADELTAWTPILGYLSSSPFIAIPCCSHNFGGTRFRAPAYPQYLTSVQFQSNSKNKQPSAYASLCRYVSHITEKVGYKPEKEHLRIPSTRNIAVVGRSRRDGGEGIGGEGSLEDRMLFTRSVVEGEMQDCSIEQVRLQWLKRGSGLVKEKGGH